MLLKGLGFLRDRALIKSFERDKGAREREIYMVNSKINYKRRFPFEK